MLHTRTAVSAVLLGMAGILADPATMVGPLIPAAAAPAAAVVPLDRGSSMAYVAAYGLNVRTGPSTKHRRVRVLAHGTRLRIRCRVWGQMIRGSVRRTTAWNRIGTRRYVSDAYVSWPRGRRSVPTCVSPGVVVTGGGRLNLRIAASTLHPRAGTLRDGTRLAVVCKLYGQYVKGTVRGSAVWNRLRNGRFVSDAYVRYGKRRPVVPWCVMGGARAPEAHSAFIIWAVRQAKPWSIRYRVPVSVTVAQAILESGWGASALTQEGNAYFGAKCFGSPGEMAVGCRSYRTSECSGRTCFRMSDTFRVYRTAAASFRDHARQLATLDRYKRAFKHVNQPNRFAVEIHRGGYATSPRYARNLVRVMRQYKLYRFDTRLRT
jgi:flagellar protein FlgJ